MPLVGHKLMIVAPRSMRLVMIGAVAAAMATLGGCADTEVEFKGGLFDMVGLSDINKPKGGEVKVPQRTGLVLPPETGRLPQPGSAPQTTASLGGDAAWPVDPEETRADKQAALQREHAAFCERARERARLANNDIIDDGPLGTCRQSILKNVTGRDTINENLKRKSE